VLMILCVTVERLRKALSRQAQDEEHSVSREAVDAENDHILQLEYINERALQDELVGRVCQTARP
jgi:hypothetical protein